MTTTAPRPRRRALWLCLALAAAAAVYARSLANGFAFDDRVLILQNSNLRSLAAVPRLFSSGYWDGTPHPPAKHYRPLTLLSYSLNYAFAADSPRAYHATNLLLHLLAVLLVFLLAETLAKDPLAGFWAALLFGLHPLHSEAVLAVAYRSELLAACGVLGAWLVHLRGGGPLPVALLFLAGLLSKESALSLLWLLPLADHLLGRKKAPGAYAALLLASAVYAFAALNVLGGLSRPLFLDNPLAYAGHAVRILTALAVQTAYARLLLVPWTLSADYSYDQIPLAVSWTDPRALAAVALFAALGYAVWRRKAPSLCLAVYLAPFVLTSNLLFPIGTVMAERLTYLPLLGFCLALAPLRRSGEGVLVLCLLAAFYGARTFARSADWKDDAALFASALKASPRSAKAHRGMALVHLEAGRLKDAEAELSAAAEIYPGCPGLAGDHRALGEAYLAGGRLQDAEWAFKAALAKEPGLDGARASLAEVYRRMKLLDKAAELGM